MHYVQKQILDNLRTDTSVHYAKLNTQGIESGHFRYHLQELVKDGLVSQPARGVYTLTPDGQRFVDRLSDKHGAPHAMPKVITYTLLTQGDVVLLHQKTKEPYRNMLNMIGGKVHEGETTIEAAQREISEKTSLSIDAPTPAGVFEILISKDQQLFTHVIAFVFHYEISAGQSVPKELIPIKSQEIETVHDLAPDFLLIYRVFSSAKDTSAHIQQIVVNLP